MANSCVAANCTNKASLNEGISLRTILYFNEERPEAKRRKIWVDFVRDKCVFEPSKNLILCSAHFKLRLMKDSIGICVYPTIQAVLKEMAIESDVKSPRDRQMVCQKLVF